MKKLLCTIMRGGTSRGAVFNRKDLPADQTEWDSIFLRVMGGPDSKQIDGLGGTVSSNNKIVVVEPSEKPGIDVEYTIAQVVPGRNMVDYRSNCGNMALAVGAYAVDEKLVSAYGSEVNVRMWNTNTKKKIDILVPTFNGEAVYHGNTKIAGISGTGASLELTFKNPEGAATGKMLPTGNVRDRVTVVGFGEVEVTLIDVSNPLILVNANQLKADATE